MDLAFVSAGALNPHKPKAVLLPKELQLSTSMLGCKPHRLIHAYPLGGICCLRTWFRARWNICIDVHKRGVAVLFAAF
jgi:hypothetical protein